MRDEWDEKYEKPVIERKIVGFSGIDPSRKLMSPEEKVKIKHVVEEQVEEIVNAVGEIRVGE